MATFYPIQTQPFTLAGAGVAIGDSSVTLSSFKQIDGTTNITMSDLGTIAFATLEPGNGTQEEQISFTGVVQNANGTATLTGVKTVAFSTPYTQTANFAKTHAGGSQFVLSNTSAFYSEFPSLPDSATISGQWVFTNPSYPKMDTATPTVTLAEQLVPKAYVDAAVISGGVNGTLTVPGIWQGAVATQVQAGVIASSGGYSLVPPNSIFGSTGVANVIKVPVTRTDGKIDASFGSAATSLATLDANSKVVQLPALATTVATANSIPLAGPGGTIASGWISFPASTAYANGVDQSWTGQTASGTLTIAHGLGIKPKRVRITANHGLGGLSTMPQSFGVYSGSSGTTMSCVFNYASTALPSVSSTTIANLRYDATNSQIATLSNVDTTNIVLSWVKEGTGINNNGNTINLMWEAQG